MNEPLVSIIIPVYNGKEYLREAIDSALQQTYSNIEVIVINDGSCDNGATEAIALSYNDKIRYFYKENGGVATALNLGIQIMKGEYFSWLSHDDIYYPNKVSKQIDLLKANGNMKSIVYSDYDFLDMTSHSITHVKQSETYEIEKLTNSVFAVLQGLIHGCSLLIHKSNFERVGLFNESLITTQDYELWFRMMRHQKIIYIPESLILVRIHSKQGSLTISCHDTERCKLHIGFLDALTKEEACSMYGNLYNFYHRMCCFFKGGKMQEAYEYANEKLQLEKIPDNLTEELKRLENYLGGISKNNAKSLCIFGAGEYGIRLYQELRSRLIKIDFFADNNPEKWGYLFDNIYCISPEKLTEEKENTLVIVANRTPIGIVKQLELNNFPYVVTKQELDKVLINISPIKWVTSLDKIKDIDYSSNEIKILINKFNETIFDICKYYEGRIKN